MVTRPPSTPSPPHFERAPPRSNFSARNRFFFELRKYHPSQYHPHPSWRPRNHRPHQFPQIASLSPSPKLIPNKAPAFPAPSDPAAARTISSLEAAIQLQRDNITRYNNAHLEPSVLTELLRESVSVLTSLDEQLSRAKQVLRPESAVHGRLANGYIGDEDYQIIINMCI